MFDLLFIKLPVLCSLQLPPNCESTPGCKLAQNVAGECARPTHRDGGAVRTASLSLRRGQPVPKPADFRTFFFGAAQGVDPFL